MVEVGVDSYVTLDEAGEYVDQNFVQSDGVREAWFALSQDDQCALLRRARREIDDLPLLGARYSAAQVLAFPRDFDEGAQVHRNVREAQVELAVSLTDGDSDRRRALQAQGVRFFRVGSFEEDFGGRWAKSGATVVSGLTSPAALRLLTPWIAGSFGIG